MKKILSIVLTFVMTISMFTLVSLAQPKSNAPLTRTKVPLPEYQKLTMEGVKELGLDAKPIVEKPDFDWPNGKSYIKPVNTPAVEHLNRTGTASGIAILVDFPAPTDQNKVSDVPFVTWKDPVPQRYFENLLNGTTYNPYEDDSFPLFAPLKAWAVKNNYALPLNRTLRNYYNEASYNRFKIDVDVTPWITLPHPYEYYLGVKPEYVNGNPFGRARIHELVEDAINEAKKQGFDFSKYAVDAKPGDFSLLGDNVTEFTDSNGNKVNKIVPNIFLVHRGTGAEYGGYPGLIWSHKWSMVGTQWASQWYQNGIDLPDSALNYEVVDGVVVDTYNICPEVGGWLYTNYPVLPPTVGVFAHEFGHVLGLPDQYDYGYDSEGTGGHTLMASGDSGRTIPSSRFSSTSPVHMDAWSKIHLGFINQDEINLIDKDTSNVKLRPLSQYPDVAKIVVPGSGGREFFLLANRQQIGYDEGLKLIGNDSHGLQVYHVVEDIYARHPSRPNEAANWDYDHRGLDQQGVDDYIYQTGESHYAFSIIQADGKFDLEYGTNMGDPGDFFSNFSKVTSIDSKGNTPVNTCSVYKWDLKSTETGINITNIIENQDGTVTFDVYFTKK